MENQDHFILAAAQAANEGAECAGEDYRERESNAEATESQPGAGPEWKK